MLPLLDECWGDRSWPEIFAQRRKFDRAAQNESYAEWLERLERSAASLGAREDEDSDGEGEDNDADEGFIKEEEEEEEGDDGGKSSTGSPVKGVAGSATAKSGNEVLKLVLEGEDGITTYKSQTDMIASFCKIKEHLTLEKHVLKNSPNRIVGCIFDITAGSRAHYRGKLRPVGFLDALRITVRYQLLGAWSGVTHPR